MIHIKIDGHCLTATTDDKLVAKCVNTVYFDAAFDDSWDGYEKRLVFSANRNPGVPVTYTGGAMLVPWNALDASGWLYISAVGLAEGKRDVTAMMHTPLFVYTNGDLGDDSMAPDYDPSPLESAVLACAKSAREAEDAARRAEEAARRAEDAIPTEPGGAGRDGGHYTPMVTQPAGDTMRVSFSPSKADMPEVADVEVKLPAGPAGHTPVKGEDYFTEQDKQEIVHDVLAEIPEGGIDVSGASVGQTIKIAAVDENGVPTAWEAVEFPSGGGESLEEIVTITTTEEVTSINITRDKNGNPFRLKFAQVYVECCFTLSNASDGPLRVRTCENTAAKGGSINLDRVFRNGENAVFYCSLLYHCGEGILCLGFDNEALKKSANYSHDLITAFYFDGTSSDSKTWGVGSKITILGVRA